MARKTAAAIAQIGAGIGDFEEWSIAQDSKAKRAGSPRKMVLEIGGKAIYELRSHPGKASWEMAAAETRAAYRARMQELLNALGSAGFKVKR